MARRPILRYFGGKFVLAPWIVGFFPEHRHYVEPFGGAASVLLNKPRCYSEVYNDLDSEVVGVFEIIRDRPGELEAALRATPFSREEFEKSYQPTDDLLERARRAMVRSFMGYGSGGTTRKDRTGFRSRTRETGSAPAQDWGRLHRHVEEWAQRLQGVLIENRPASEVIEMHDYSDTLFYVDPPYVQSTRAPAGGNNREREYRHELDDDAHAALLEQLKSVKGMVIISGYASEIYSKALEGWRLETTTAYAAGNRKAKPSQKRTEHLWLSPKVPMIEQMELEWE